MNMSNIPNELYRSGIEFGFADRGLYSYKRRMNEYYPKS
jgi:hypothetical protein